MCFSSNLPLLFSCVSSFSAFLLVSDQMRLLYGSLLSLRRFNAVFSTGTIRRATSSTMRLVQFCHVGDEGQVKVGVEQKEGQGVVDLKAFDPSIPYTMREFLKMGRKGMDCADRYETAENHMRGHMIKTTRKQNNTKTKQH